jgi:hypothetical protein
LGSGNGNARNANFPRSKLQLQGYSGTAVAAVDALLMRAETRLDDAPDRRKAL